MGTKKINSRSTANVRIGSLAIEITDRYMAHKISVIRDARY